MRILISGGFGFIGGRIADSFSQEGHNIILGSRKLRKKPSWLPHGQVKKTDWNDTSSLKNICKGVDVVIQASGMNSEDCSNNPSAAALINGDATRKLAEAAREAKVKKFIYLSTAHIYKNPLLGFIDEESFPLNEHPYATSHVLGENLALEAAERSEMVSIVFRLSNAFGVPMHKSVNCWMLLVNDLCKQAVETQKLKLHGPGNQMRDFISLSKVCQVIREVSINEDLPIKSGVYNLGTGLSKSVIEMATIIQQRFLKILKKDLNLIYSKEILKNDNNKLDYNVDKLSSLGLNLSDEENILEIDRLIIFCLENFSQK